VAKARELAKLPPDDTAPLLLLGGQGEREAPEPFVRPPEKK